ncbi:MAG: hypothetical protein ACYCWW_04225 [Deltaproteobacteria bacterium]
MIAHVWPRHLHRLPLAALCLAGALSACCRKQTGLTTQNVCPTLNDWCSPGADAGQEGTCADHTVCDAIHKTDPDYSKGSGCYKCYFEPRACVGDKDCCPGQRCGQSVGVCFDCYNVDQSGSCGTSDCTSDDQCVQLLGPGHVCSGFTEPDGGPQIQGEQPSRRCSYPTCKTSSDCPAGSTCFPTGAAPTGYCVIAPPCAGSCPAGSACAVTDDLCSAVNPTRPGCSQSCAPGTMLVYTDQSVPTGVYDSCDLPAVSCDCATLPPLHSDDLGRYSSLAAQNGQVWVSAYDGQYGDLVAFHFAPDGGQLALEYVDGVPATGTVVADPNGPRHGISQPGPNVGEFTSVALGSDGQPRIAFYDLDHKSLKFAQRQSSGGWTVGWVDGWTGQGSSDGSDVGRYTSIALDPSGLPTISYFQAAGPTAGDPLATAVKLAHAKVASPQSPSDWTISVVETEDAPAPPCYGNACPKGQLCLNDGSNRGLLPDDAGIYDLPDGGCAPNSPPNAGGSCYARATGCPGDGGCPAGDQCVTSDGGPTCLPAFATPSFQDLPEGVGLFTSLAFSSSGTPLVAYYDRLHGDLHLAVGSAGGFTVTTVDGSDPVTCADTGDVGQFPSLRVTGSTWAIAYQDATNEQLLYWTGTAPSTVSPDERVIVDTGTIQPPAPNNAEDTPMWIGAGASLAFGGSGTAYLAYQNQTAISLRLSSEPAACGTQAPQSCQTTVVNEWTSEPEGFYSQVAIDGAKGYASSAQIQATATGVNNRLLLEGPLPLP